MTNENKCPKCGAEEVAATTDRTLIRYLCHSMLKDGKPYSQSRQCEFDELRAKLEMAKPYLKHLDGCSIWRPIVGCDCGLSEVLATLE
jgi:hypothetical protein